MNRNTMRGLTSLEIAIIVAIILVIAVAVGWYLYTTFAASTTAQARLSVSSAEFSNGTLTLYVINPGPADVTIQAVNLAGQSCSGGSGGDFTIGNTINAGDAGTLVAECSGVTAQPGTTLQGTVITTAGTSFPFTAVVKP